LFKLRKRAGGKQKTLENFRRNEVLTHILKCCKKLRVGHGKLQDDPRRVKKELT
jgi:hypothetical protein